MRIAAVSVAYNDKRQIRLFLEHCHEYMPRLHCHVIVDNGSESSYREELRRSFPNSVFIQREVNGGTTAAYNDGIRYVMQRGADAILLIAQDIRLSATSLESMVQALESCPAVGIVGPLLLRPDGSTVEEYGGTIDVRKMTVSKLYTGLSLDSALPDELCVDFVAGGVNLTRKEVFEQIGLQHERLFMYGDETDFDLRVARAGWRLLVTRRAVAVHAHVGDNSASRPWPLYFLTRNRLWLIRKHLGRKALLAASVSEMMGLPRRVAYYLKRHQPELAGAYVRGVAHGMLMS